MTVKEIMARLESLGSPQIKNIHLKHGIKEPLFGVKVSDLKPIQKQIKKDYQLAKDLYATGNADAMYLAGLIADDKKMTKKDLQSWVKQADSDTLCGYTVPWVAAESLHGYELALEWIESKEAHIAAAGWSTLSNLVALKPDSELDLKALKALLARVGKTIHASANCVKYNMNNFIISVGAYVTPLTEEAIATAKKMGVVKVDMHGTAREMPDAIAYIKKIEDRGSLGKKKKTVKC
ncbi:DNA alkylation repair protein [Flavitalea sp. BT771]|uniref:DNA alkylation repair protein n=1 Tax=Flavitalea sp. BT771 TaxID=3063329 RepID=UPI0026E1A2D2|nr:DNA alkylation repair protein [Flavitalea sp. BT771]MDO6432518.1 DNA alkylation repair protein [Flavitalea sp. BT771]MDV6221427.1 DNA alkylation repair protein [Flavitalea sp. BT771]